MHGGPPPWVLELLGIKPKRAERGEVRFLILDAIRDQPRHGYEIIQHIEKQTGGSYRPSPGTVYPTLQMLEEMGLAESTEEGGRRVYKATEAGLKELEDRADEVEDSYDRLGRTAEWADFDPEYFHHIFGRGRLLMRSVGRAFRRGRLGPDQLREIQQALEDAMERIERALRKKD